MSGGVQQTLDGEPADKRAKHVRLGPTAQPPDPQQSNEEYAQTAREGWCHHPDCYNHITQTAAKAGADPAESAEYGHALECPYHIHGGSVRGGDE